MSSQSPRTDSVVDSCSERDHPDYESVRSPSGDRAEWTYVERRAELLQLISEAGTPDALNQTALADRYGVTQQQISKDVDRLAEYTHARLADRDRRALFVDSVARRSVRGLLDDGEWRKAAKTAIDYDEWVREFHNIDEIEARLDRLEDAAE